MRRVVVSGIGAVTPLGGDIKSTWENLIKNKSGANLISKFDTSDFQTKISCEVPLKSDQNSSAISFCFNSSLEKIIIFFGFELLITYLQKFFPKEPVPPETKIDLLSNII